MHRSDVPGGERIKRQLILGFEAVLHTHLNRCRVVSALFRHIQGISERGRHGLFQKYRLARGRHLIKYRAMGKVGCADKERIHLLSQGHGLGAIKARRRSKTPDRKFCLGQGETLGIGVTDAGDHCLIKLQDRAKMFAAHHAGSYHPIARLFAGGRHPRLQLCHQRVALL